MVRIIDKAVRYTFVGIGCLMTVFFALLIPVGVYAMNDRNPLETVVLLWLVFCCTWMIMAALGRPEDSQSKLLRQITDWKHDDAM